MKEKEENKENLEQNEVETPISEENTTEENTVENTQETEKTEEKEAVEPPSDAEIIVELTKNVAEFKDKYLRLYSDFENFRRRTA